MADASNKSLLRKIHDAACPCAVTKFGPLQKICPVCKSSAANK